MPSKEAQRSIDHEADTLQDLTDAHEAASDVAAYLAHDVVQTAFVKFVIASVSALVRSNLAAAAAHRDQAGILEDLVTAVRK